MDDVYGIGLRFIEDQGFVPDAGESWIFKTEQGPDPGTTRLTTLMVKGTWLTGIWRSRQDKVYVADIGGFVLHGPLESGELWPEKQVGFTLSGIWGLDDEHVYVWGFDGDTSAMARWNGTAWKRFDSPSFEVQDLHGIAPDLLVAVGGLGEISLWNGSQWRSMESGTRKTLSCVFVSSANEMYASGHGGALLQGDSQGWQIRVDGLVQLPCVTKWRDEVYVGTYGELGLCKLESGGLVSFKPRVQAISFDVRGELVALMNGNLVGTSDGEDYSATGIGLFASVTAPFPPLW
jgi:hypothetical protein